MLSLGGQWPPASPAKTKARYSGIPGLRHGRFRLRGYHPLRRGFPAHFGYRPPAVPEPTTPHLPSVFPKGFGLGSPPFGRPYSGVPCWFLFLRVLRCFLSPRSRPLRGAGAYSAPAGSPIRGSRVQRPPAATPGLSQLATPFLGARAEPSTGRLGRADGGLRGRARSPLGFPPRGLGGDPAAGSPTATLLRLHPPREFSARPPTQVAPSKGPRRELPRVVRRAVCASPAGAAARDGRGGASTDRSSRALYACRAPPWPPLGTLSPRTSSSPLCALCRATCRCL